ncbi:hypothetical protein QJS10_CPB19g01148 [Acorus calamus]|uniref:Ureidoglycolate hydrolase n=1 Tax=Acorus calamus TaxID=4465 RepID=A0AAV9CGR7_ACOCL|nr:hypothetical protein QJS10_CPB19g01148 [Acorus calamus]
MTPFTSFSMASKIPIIVSLLLLFFATTIRSYEDPTKKTMEQFSGYPTTETQSCNSDIPSSSLSVDSESLQRQLEKDVLARRFIKDLMGRSGLSVHEDAVGNIFGRWEGTESELPAVATGSHIDAIPYSGKYDGVVGVLGAIEAINVLRRSGFKPKRSLEVILFTSEEPTRFGISCLGRLAGYAKDQEDLSSVFMKEGHYSAFLELHIEQGPILEEEGISIGIVTAIAAPASIKVDFEGNGGHAGAVLMPYRNDAGLAAAELALAVEKHVLDSGSVDTVGTVGIMELHPGAINSIPSKSHVEIDTRDIDESRRDTVIEKVHLSAIAIAEKRKVKLSEFRIVNKDPPALSDKSVIEAMQFASQHLNLSHKFMISRAYHDSLFMARISPMGMIFIPCYKGYSHKPEEHASIEDIANGVKVLAVTMAKLSLK